MNREARRRAQRRRSRELRHGGQLFDASIIRSSDLRTMILARIFGDPEAARLSAAIDSWMAAAPRHGPLCVQRSHEFSVDGFPAGFLIVAPWVASPSGGFVAGLCESCAAMPDDALVTSAAERLQMRMINRACVAPEVGWA